MRSQRPPARRFSRPRANRVTYLFAGTAVFDVVIWTAVALTH